MKTNSNPNSLMSSGQGWALFCIFHCDARKASPPLTYGQASEVITFANSGHTSEAVKILAGHGLSPKDSTPKVDWQPVYDEAHAAGMAAGENHAPVPMVVQQHANPLDDKSPVTHQYEPIMDGVCGFASIVVRPGTCSFAKWLTKNKLAGSHYYGGVAIHVHQFNQSYERKEKYASAFAEVLHKHGVNAHIDSRLD